MEYTLSEIIDSCFDILTSHENQLTTEEKSLIAKLMIDYMVYHEPTMKEED